MYIKNFEKPTIYNDENQPSMLPVLERLNNGFRQLKTPSNVLSINYGKASQRSKQNRLALQLSPDFSENTSVFKSLTSQRLKEDDVDQVIYSSLTTQKDTYFRSK